MIFYDNKQLDRLVEKKLKFESFLDNLNFCGLKYEIEYTHSSIREPIFNEILTNKYKLVSLNNKRIKLRKNSFAYASY